MHALVIEDYVLLGMQIADELRDIGFYSVSCATTCAEAIDVAFAQRPDLITAESRMGVESGIEAVTTICADNPIPVVYIVATPDDVRSQVADAIILEKPFNSVGLRRAVALALESGATGLSDFSSNRLPQILNAEARQDIGTV